MSGFYMPGKYKLFSNLPVYYSQRRACLRVQALYSQNVRQFFHSNDVRLRPSEPEEDKKTTEVERGAMSRKLEEMTDQSLEESGYRAQKVVAEAGFSEDLKKRLAAKIEDSEFRSQNAAAFATLDMLVGYDPSMSIKSC